MARRCTTTPNLPLRDPTPLSPPRRVYPGIYSAPVPDLLAVHALEHGHVVIQYGSGVTAGVVAQLTHLSKVFAGDTLLALRPSLERGIALTAWGRIDRFIEYDERRVIEFVEQLRGRYNHGWTGPDACTSRPAASNRWRQPTRRTSLAVRYGAAASPPTVADLRHDTGDPAPVAPAVGDWQMDLPIYPARPAPG